MMQDNHSEGQFPSDHSTFHRPVQCERQYSPAFLPKSWISCSRYHLPLVTPPVQSLNVKQFLANEDLLTSTQPPIHITNGAFRTSTNLSFERGSQATTTPFP